MFWMGIAISLRKINRLSPPWLRRLNEKFGTDQQLTRYPRFAPLIQEGLRVRRARPRASPTLRSPANPRSMPRVCPYGLAQRRR